MHELTLCRNILQIIDEQAASDDFHRVKRVCLDVGILAAVEPEAMRFGFEVASRGGIAEGARLEINTLPAQARCPACQRQAEVDSWLATCPHCGAAELVIGGGDELRIRELEVE